MSQAVRVALFRLTTACLVVLVCLTRTAGADDKPLWLLVTTPSLEKSLAGLVEKRRQDGFDVVVSTAPIREALKSGSRSPDYILIVGDWEAGKGSAAWAVETKSSPMYRWIRKQPESFVSDAAWGDLDSDGVPEVPVGRIPARNAADAALVVEKILAYENRRPTTADLRLPVWTGAPGYVPLVDSLVSTMLLSAALKRAPGWAESWVLCGDLNSPLCGWPPAQPETFNAALKKGGFIATMMGHASRQQFSSVAFRNAWINYTPRDVQQGLAKGPPVAPLVLFACDAGDFTGSSPCLAEWLVGMPGGPVAVIAATANSHPITNYYSGVSLLDEACLGHQRIGQLWLAVQRRSLTAHNPLVESILKDVEGKLEDEINMAKLRRDQVLMYALLGDPATPTFLPAPLEVDLKRDGSALLKTVCHGGSCPAVPAHLPRIREKARPFGRDESRPYNFSTGHDGSRWRWKVARPTGAVDLEVGLRAKSAMLPPAAPPANRSDAQKAMQKANAAFRFETVANLGADQPWEGTVEGEGTLRFVVMGEGVFQAAAFDLGASPTAPERAQ